MKKAVIFILIMLVMFPLLAKKVGGVNLPENLTFGGERLILNGAGVRKKLIIKVYAGGLYLPRKTNNSRAILADDSAIAVRMHFIYKQVAPEKLIEAWNEGFQNGGYATKFAAEIKKFNQMFYISANKGDIYDIVYLPGKGVQVIRNGDVIGTINKPGFRKAVFSIWLGEDTALPKLKKAMLDK